MSALKAFLEDFERPGATAASNGPAAAPASQADDEPLRRAADDAYAKGYAAGEAAALDRARLDQTALDSAAAQLGAALDGLSADIKVQFCEALKAAVEKVFPPLARMGFAESCAAAVAEAVAGSAAPGSLEPHGAHVTLRASPSQARLLEDAFARLDREPAVRVIADAGLADLEIRAAWDDAGLDLNYDEAIRQAAAALDHTIAQLQDRT